MNAPADSPAKPDPAVTAQAYRARQRSRAAVMAWLLGGFVVLMFAISIAKIGGNLH